MLAGSAISVLASGLGFAVSGVTVYISALTAALLAGLCTWSGPVAVVSGILLVCGLGGVIAIDPDGLGAMRSVLASWRGMEADAQLMAQGGRMMAMLSAYILGALFAAFVSGREFAPLAIIIFMGLAVVGYSLSDGTALIAAMPGLVAAVAAFALSTGPQRDINAMRIMIPAVLVVALAFMFVPGEGRTWKPLEDAAQRVRNLFEQYFNFSSERIAFSINEHGYDHAGVVGDEVVAMLGGPANPDTEPVMTVTSDEDILLRGTIRTAYTGYSWVDETVKNRYLYYDVTRTGVRDRVFGREYDSAKGAFVKAEASVEMVSEGTSTLFVPARLDDFSMDLTNAVYYNSAGEMFMARPVQPGDKYSLTALNPVHGEGLSRTVLAAMEERDERYNQILSDHTALPAGIDSAVYTLAIELTQDYSNPYDKADAIRRYLTANYHYTLEPVYPPEGRDFVSHFLMDTKEGYCSYFASAMVVMCRIAGLPARYVEGYLARPDETGTVTVTGEDAHAWVEVYFKGMGWISFDPSGGQHSGGEDGLTDDSLAGEDAEMDVPNDELLTTPTPSPTPAVHPDDVQNDGLDNFESDENDPEPTPTLPPTDEQDDPFSPEEDDPEGWGAPTVDEDPWSDEKDGNGWLWILLCVLVALGLVYLAVMFVRYRLRNADPIWLSGRARSAREAAMILYRADLTLLSHMGIGPLSGESPEAFAHRISPQFSNDDFERFAQAVSLCVYAGKPIDRDIVMTGRRAYGVFLSAMRPLERLRYTATRFFRGLGNFEAIP